MPHGYSRTADRTANRTANRTAHRPPNRTAKRTSNRVANRTAKSLSRSHGCRTANREPPDARLTAYHTVNRTANRTANRTVNRYYDQRTETRALCPGTFDPCTAKQHLRAVAFTVASQHTKRCRAVYPASTKSPTRSLHQSDAAAAAQNAAHPA